MFAGDSIYLFLVFIFYSFLFARRCRLQKADGRRQREALIEAVRAFHADGAAALLRNAREQHSGAVNWWQWRYAGVECF
jgi:hypothetical protein